LLAAHGLAAYEPETMATYLAALEVLPMGVVFDVGANVGVFSLIAAALTRWVVIAFEPAPNPASVARSAARTNGLHYEVEQIALGATDGMAPLYLSDTDVSSSLRAGFRAATGSIEVRVEALAGYCGRTGRMPSLLKIDTEGTEADVLRGGTDLLRRRRPWLICEVLKGRTEDALMAELEPLLYRMYQITDEVPLAPGDVIEGDPTHRFTNWLFAPEEPSAEFWDAKRAWQHALEATATAETVGPSN
jgi:FkbM family methyltransferase